MKALSDFLLRLLTRFPMARWSTVALRLIVGYGFMQHGFAKLSRGPDLFAAILQGMGVPAPHLMAWLTILTELVGGFAVLLGAFVTIASLPMAAYVRCVESRLFGQVAPGDSFRFAQKLPVQICLHLDSR